MHKTRIVIIIIYVSYKFPLLALLMLKLLRNVIEELFKYNRLNPFKLNILFISMCFESCMNLWTYYHNENPKDVLHSKKWFVSLWNLSLFPLLAFIDQLLHFIKMQSCTLLCLGSFFPSAWSFKNLSMLLHESKIHSLLLLSSSLLYWYNMFCWYIHLLMDLWG